MIIIWILTAILQSLGFEPAMLLWAWFGDNWLLTIILLIIFA